MSRFIREFVTGNAELQNYFDGGTNGIKASVSRKGEFVKKSLSFSRWLVFLGSHARNL